MHIADISAMQRHLGTASATLRAVFANPHTYVWPITTSPLGKHAVPQSADDNAAVLPSEIAHTKAHLKDKKCKYHSNSCMNLRPIYFNDTKMDLSAQLLSAL